MVTKDKSGIDPGAESRFLGTRSARASRRQALRYVYPYISSSFGRHANEGVCAALLASRNKVIYSTIRANGGIDDQGKEREQQRDIIAIVGPTAVGKSSLAVALARKFNGEVVSADSRQVYKGLNIGTGKITKKEMRGVPHHLLDVANPKRQFSVSEYQKLTRKKLEEILGKGNPRKNASRSRGKLPIIVGGTGLYIQAIVNDVAFPEVPPNKTLRKKLEKKTADQLLSILRKIDAERAKTIDKANPRRLVRAIEIATALGKVPPYRNIPRRDIEVLFIGLTVPSNELKKRISIRLFARMNECMIEEVEHLHKRGLTWRRMEELGLEYRYISRYLRGFLSKEEMTQRLQSEIWHYAKRQMTWFRRDRRIRWFLPNERSKIVKAVANFLKP